MSEHVATATVIVAEPVVDRASDDVPLIGKCLACDWVGIQAIRIRYVVGVEVGRAEAESEAAAVACHLCEGVVMDILREQSGE